MARRLTEEAGPTVEWLADHGVGVSDIYFSGDDRVARGHVMDGGGEAIVACLLAAAKADPRIDLAFGRRVDRLLTVPGGSGGGGSVTGVAVGEDQVTASAVVLAAGGFGANKELWPRFSPPGVERVDVLHRAADLTRRCLRAGRGAGGADRRP